ncbi:MAG: DUF6494 family protein [Pseudomonadales bacterium]|jgi:hypothetical protein|nr:DUF6494 family protein [Pseudomonadales bacterium]MDP7597273.1 DUF6494 family protein [Pseudomonadales bacterium]HJN49766.1 DUF6494 family protein [Pseudomonadales bacterium]|tara:strand:+ start:321 stop:527 length:207 start_codon:yes stop_codon:yes gene_type:complete
MNEDTFNTAVRKYLKQVGITSQREIEQAVQTAIQEGTLSGSEQLVATVTLEIPSLSLTHKIDGEIALE